MAGILSAELVSHALRHRLGPGLSAIAAEPALEVLRSYIPRRTELADIAARLEDTLFTLFYRQLGPGMRFRREDGVVIRLRTDDLPDLADDCMGVLFACMLPSQNSFLQIQRYAMTSGSMAALRALSTDFATYQSPQELALVNHILQDRGGPTVR